MDEKQIAARELLREAVDELTRAASIMKKDSHERHHVVIARGKIDAALTLDGMPPRAEPAEDKYQTTAREILRGVCGLLAKAAAKPSDSRVCREKTDAMLLAKDKIQTALFMSLSKPVRVAEPPLTASALAVALGGFWNAALGASQRRQEGAAFAEIMGEGFAEIQRGLQDQADKHLKPEGEDHGEAN